MSTTIEAQRTIGKSIELYRECEKAKYKYSDEPPNLEYFIEYLEEKLENVA